MKRLLILSGKGGTGKTTVSAALIKLSNAKAIADCDVDAPNLHLVLKQNICPQRTNFMGGNKAIINKDLCIGCGECEKKCRFDAINIIKERAIVNEFSCEGCGVCEYICPVNAVKLIPDIAGEREIYNDKKVFSTATLKMGRGNSGKLVTEVKLDMLKYAPECEIAIIDGSPGIGCPVMASIGGMDLVLIVAEPSKSGISDLKRLVKTAKNFNVELLVCINKYDISPMNTEDIEKYCKGENIPLIGKIPFDKEAIKAVNSGYTIVDIECQAGEVIKKIYKAILNHKINSKINIYNKRRE